MENKNKGITLIALIITIIVMLILVAVTINMAVNGGLFGYAGNAAAGTKAAQEAEKELANGTVGGQTIDDLVAGFSILESGKTIPTSGIYLRMPQGVMPTIYYSEVTNADKNIINNLFTSYGYSLTFDMLTYGGDTPPTTIETNDRYLYGDYVYAYNYEINSNVLTGWSATTYETKTSYQNPLKSINGEELKHLYGAFRDRSQLITAPSIPSGVTDIEKAFYDCTDLKSVTIPSSLSTIGYYAFYRCTSLKNITISSGVSSIGTCAFRECTNLKSITIPSSVTSIGESAFNGCDSITDVEVPTSITNLSSWVFSSCDNLTSVTIPNSVTSIGECVFADSFRITNLTYNGTISQWNSIEKSAYWNDRSNITTIHCTNGDVTVESQ